MTAHKKMARSERAKQFMPFAALKGYTEALREKEDEVLSSYADEEIGGACSDSEERSQKVEADSCPDDTKYDRIN